MCDTLARESQVVELRQYTLKAGRRDTLIQLFERHFVEAQEAAGMTVIGQFRDRGRPDRFVWLRGFADMASRQRALGAFYDGPIWAAWRADANDTMLDSDDVLLLKPARPDLALGVDRNGRARARAAAGPVSVLAGTYHLPAPVVATQIEMFEKVAAPALAAAGVHLEGVYVRETSPNTFPRLPVREGEDVLLWFGTCEREAAPGWLDRLARDTALGSHEAVLLDLEPTPRSMLGRAPLAARATKHDFDFLFGSWTVHNRRLNGRLCGSTDWTEFEARSDVEPLLDGFAHLDRYRATLDGAPFEGITLRLFDPASGEWSIHWADSVRAHTLLAAMAGRFMGDAGEFHGDETANGRRVRARFLWTRSASPRWEQAFSGDDGATWETNWIMTFTRRESI